VLCTPVVGSPVLVPLVDMTPVLVSVPVVVGVTVVVDIPTVDEVVESDGGGPPQNPCSHASDGPQSASSVHG
jgi:hypothetical protein